MSSGTVATICSARTTQTWRSGTSVSARRPWPGPPSSAIVPVSAQAAAQVVSAPSRASSSCGPRPSSTTSSTRVGRSAGSRSPGTTTRAAPCSASASSTPSTARPGSTTVAPVSRTRSTKRATTADASAGGGASSVGRCGGGPAPSSARRMRPSTSSRAALTCLPPLAERLLGNARQRRASAPRRRAGRAASGAGRRGRRAAESARPSAARARSARASRRRGRARCSARPSRPGRARRDDLRPLVDEDPRDVDQHRADVGARAAERRGERQRRRRSALARELRLQDRADRAGVDEWYACPPVWR